MKTNKIVKISLLISLSLIMFLVESLFPPLFIIAPYVKIGLSNIFIILIMIIYGEKESILATLIKNILGSTITGSWFAFPYNIVGGISSIIVMVILYKFIFPKISIIMISIIGAITSNIGRTMVAIIMLSQTGFILQLPILLIISVCSGVTIGVAVKLIIKILPKKI